LIGGLRTVGTVISPHRADELTSAAGPLRVQLLEPPRGLGRTDRRRRGRAAADTAARLLGTPRIAVSLACAGIALLILVGASAPNVNTLLVRLPLSRLPSPPAWITCPATVAAVLLDGLGLLGMLRARSRGWAPNPRRLYGAGAAAVLVLVNLTPVGSSDPASYAAYGRIAALGRDPYTTTPHDALQGSEYYRLIGSSWQRTPSVYGPVATWIQAAAAHLGGARPWVTIWVLLIVNGLVFLAVGWILLRTSGDPVRATLLWTANPLLLEQFVSGGHLDTFVAAGTVCALCALRGGRSLRRAAVAGALLGLTLGVKIDAGLVVAALAWPMLRDRQWSRPAAMSLSCAATLAGVYAGYGMHALRPLSSASKLISVPSVWDVPWALGKAAVGAAMTSAVICVLWPLLLISLVWLLGRRFPVPSRDPAGGVALIVIAWTLAAPWTMPWYGAPGWVALGRCRRTPLTWLLVAPAVLLAMVHSSGGHAW
jgi:hypothetical protein